MRLLRWKAARIVQHAWSRLYCNFYGHHYKPYYTEWGNKVQYECCCCGELTPWMHKREHREFVRTVIPSWGDRGSDSQGYRKMGKLDIPPKERTIEEPEGGWEDGIYLVRIALKPGKPIHNAILHAPFIGEGGIRNETVWVPNGEREYRVRDLHYLEVVRRSDELSEFL